MIIRLATARTVMLGPVLDADGVAKTDLAVAAILASKNGGAPSALDGSATLVHQQTGHYLLALTVNDTTSPGVLELSIDSTTDAMPIKALNVIYGQVFDSFFDTDILQVDILEIKTSAGFATTLGNLMDDGVGSDNKIKISADAQDLSATLDVNTKALGGTVQSATDLKDFADTGYDPSTHVAQADLHYILAHLLTQTGTQLADGFQTFFDIASPVDTVAVPKRGTDSAATAAKLLAYLQLLARKDDAIETDNAAELTEINADGGSGVGTFLNETDALEGLRDRGDQAWITGGGSGATKSYTTEAWTRTVGDDDGGAGSDTATVNATYFSTGEVNSTTLLEVTVVFTLDDVTETARSLDFWGFYNGGGAHYIEVKALDTVGAVYEPLTGAITVGSTVEKTTFELSPNHTDSSTGTVTIKFLHGGSAVGTISHVFSVDKAQVNSSVPSTTAAKLLSYVQLLARSDAAIETDRSTELAEINGNEGSGAGNFSSQTDSTEAIRDRGDAEWITATSVTVSDKTGFSLVSTGLDLVTAWTTNITGNITGNLSGSVGSVTGAVGSVTGAVGSVTGSIGSLGAQAKLDVNAEADTANSDYGALKPTSAGRTLDVTAGGTAGMNYGNVENVTTTYDFTNTTINAVSNVTVSSLGDDSITSDSVEDGAFTSVKFNADVWTTSADALLTRDVDNVEATAGIDTMCGAVLASLHWDTSGNSLLVYRTDDTTLFETVPIVTDSGADGVITVTA